MKILHTADWHLGAKTEGRSRLNEQRKILAQIEKMADEESVSVVIISGDIFDQAVPTSEAEDLFYETLDNLTKKKNRVVIAIAGNHDDHKRLLAGVHFAKKHNAIIVGNLNPKVEKIETDKMLVESLAPGSIDISVKTARGIQRVVVACLPYPSEYRMDEEVKAEDYASKVAAWARLVCKGFRKDSVNILATHIMLVGSNRYASEDGDVVRVGDINAVSKSDLPKADYYALGHIHSCQNMKGNYCYSGAPLMLDFKQKTAGVCLIETSKDAVRKVEYKELTCANKMVEIEIHKKNKLDEIFEKFTSEDIVNVTFIQDEPLNSDFIKTLKANYPCVAQVKLRRENISKDDVNYVSNRKNLDMDSLFTNFYKARKFMEPNKDVLKLFKELMEDM